MEGIPEGWGTRLHESGDLDASFAEVRDLDGYTGESLRARVRSLQMRLPEAERGFRRCVELALTGRPGSPEQVALTAAYERENDMLIGRAPRRRTPPRLEETSRTVEAIMSLHRSLDALEALVAGCPMDGRWLFEELLEGAPEAGPERKALWNAGLAVAAVQLAEEPEALRRLEVAGLHACDPGCRALGRVQIAARLAHVHEYLGGHAAAEDWLSFLAAVHCPEATKQAMRRRAQLLGRRSLALGRCVVC
jgi:hypothetical protein